MKKRNLFLTLGLALGLGVGVAAGLGARGLEAKEVEATVVPVSLAGSFNSWSTSANPLTLNGDYYTLTMNMTSGTTFKFVVNEEKWGGWKSDMPYPSGCFSATNGDGSDIRCDVTGDYIFKAVSGITSYGDIRYGVSIESVVEPTYVDVTVQATFTADVPEYVDIFAPGSYNSWIDSDTSAKMTRVNARTFTLALNDIVVGDYKYKLVAEYAGATSISWAHQIDGSNQDVTFEESDDGKTVALGDARTYDFATNMPQEEIADGAAVQLTFENAVPTTVDIIFVGSLTSWGTSAARLAAGKMTPNGTRKVFTWAIPEHTNVGDYEYKIVAMSKYGNAATVSYSYIVYGQIATNETLTLDSSTLIYPLDALDTNLNDLAALGMAEGFLGAMAAKCTDEDADNHSGVASIWTTWKNEYEGLSSDIRTVFKTSDNATIARARGLYHHVMTRYSAYLTAWTDGPSASYNIGTLTNETNNVTPIVIILISVIGLVAVGSIFVIRRRKENN